MAFRNVAEARRRAFGGFATFAAAVALLGAAPTSALGSSEASLSSSKTILALSLVRATDAKEALAVSGVSVGSDPTQFSAVATLSRIPCPGPYRYDVQSENQRTGAQSAYSAVVTLASLSNRTPPCGEVPPSRPGELRLSISGDGEPIDFRHARWSGSGGFFGDLTTMSQPECDKRYILSIGVDLRGWHRIVRYRLKVVTWKAEAQGLPLEGYPHC